ncbi:hypothetical protein ACIBG0_38830 [Nocardia sp. NPDC050630]|uniref:hypothetical protein n=1 Tax=Nocardia sp. NPDC050630 TaxID=3364321 RepID=UPI0037996B34
MSPDQTTPQPTTEPDPFRCFGHPIVRCPDCGHGIDPHGVDPGGRCGVGDEHGVPCPCPMQPNGIARLLIDQAVTKQDAEVLVEGSYFRRAELPTILGNFMRSNTAYGRQWKDATVEADKLRKRNAELAERSEKRRIRMVAAEEDLAEARGLLSPNGHPLRIPTEVDIQESVAPAVVWLLDRVAELEAFVSDLASEGLRCNLNPTLNHQSPQTYADGMRDYLRRVDATIRDRARRLEVSTEAGHA